MTIPSDRIAQDLRDSVASRDDYLTGLDAQLKLYRGGTAMRGKRLVDSPENPIFSVMSVFLPMVGFSNPQLDIRSETLGEGDPETEVFQAAMRRWMQQVKFYRILRRGTVDALFRMSCAYIQPEVVRQRDGYTLSLPVPRIFSLRRFTMDHLCPAPDERRYTAHMVIRDKNDLKREIAAMPPGHGWNLKEIEGAPDGGGVATTCASKLPLRKGQIAYWLMHIPDDPIKDFGPDKGFNGRVLTLLDSNPDVRLREDQPFFGPADGPYRPLWYYDAGDESPWGISPFTAGRGAIEDLQDQCGSLNRNLARRKKIAAVARRNPELQRMIKAAADGSVVAVDVENLQTDLREIELGAPTEAQVAAVIMAKQRWDDESGVNSARRGQVSGEGLATEQNQAWSGGETRIGYLQQVTGEWASDVLRLAGWYMFYHGGVAVEIGRSPGGVSIVHVGGSKDYSAYQNFRTDIRLASIERNSEAGQHAKARELVASATAISQLPPWVDAQLLSEVVADLQDMPELARMVDPILQAKLTSQGQSSSSQPAAPNRVIFGETRSGSKPNPSQGRTVPRAKPGAMEQARKLLAKAS